MNTKTPQRIIEIDLLRGLAVIGMIIYHFFFIVDFFGIKSIPIQSGGWLVLARLVQFTFLILVGISQSLSSKKSITNNIPHQQFFLKQVRRGIIILGLGFIITIATTITTPDLNIKFGILHLIGSGIILTSPFARSKFIPLFISIIIFFLTPLVTSIITDHYLFYPLGVVVRNISGALDYFPFFPWLGLIFLGISLGNFIYKDPISKIKKLPSTKGLIQFIIFNSRYALTIYILHVPIILLLLFLTLIINPELIK